MAGGQGSGAADLATRRAEGTAETATTRTVVAERWIVYPAAAGTSESRLELRLCKSDDPRRPGATHLSAARRIHTGVPGVASGTAVGEHAGDRSIGGCDVGAGNPGTHPLGQWARVHCQGVAGVAGEGGHRNLIHRAWEPMGKRVLRK